MAVELWFVVPVVLLFALVFDGVRVLAEPVFDPCDPDAPVFEAPEPEPGALPLGAAVVFVFVPAEVPACGLADWSAVALPPPVAFAFWLAFVFWLVLAFVFAFVLVFVGANVLLYVGARCDIGAQPASAATAATISVQ